MAQTKTKLSVRVLEKARKDLNEDQSKVPDQIQSLRKKILEDPTLNFRTDDAFLIRFLRASLFDQDRAMELVIKYYKQRVKYPELFSKTTSELDKALSLHFTGALPQRDPEGRAVMLFLFDNWVPSQVSYASLIYAMLMTLELLVEDEEVQINGCVLVVDLKGLTLTQVSHMTPWKVKEAVHFLFNCFPLRFLELHYLNESSLFDSIFMIAKPFMSKKLQEKIIFHGNCLASFHEYIPPEILPERLGGDIDPFNFDKWNGRVQKHAKVLNDSLSKYGFLKIDDSMSYKRGKK